MLSDSPIHPRLLALTAEAIIQRQHLQFENGASTYSVIVFLFSISEISLRPSNWYSFYSSFDMFSDFYSLCRSWPCCAHQLRGEQGKDLHRHWYCRRQKSELHSDSFVMKLKWVLKERRLNRVDANDMMTWILSYPSHIATLNLKHRYLLMDPSPSLASTVRLSHWSVYHSQTSLSPDSPETPPRRILPRLGR